jgi:NAD(P)-dependent dehydrogenase (short-subunit alcohol dehydrogenase family)
MLPLGSTSLSLSGLSALVIGGSSGIGEAASHGFAEAGARVAVAARRPEKLDAALEGLAQRSPSAKGYVATWRVGSNPGERPADSEGTRGWQVLGRVYQSASSLA